MSGEALGGLLTGSQVLLVGVEPHPFGGTRCYIGHRGRGLYVLVLDPGDQERVRAAWSGRGGHVTIPTPPPGAVHHVDDPPAADDTLPGHDEPVWPCTDCGEFQGAGPNDRCGLCLAACLRPAPW